jgi:DnaJ like chaperone protein
MAWWGTLLGGALGYMFGGPLGALLGVAVGRNFDHGVKQSYRQGAFDPGGQERVQAAFFTATFSVMGHVAKSDGKVTHDEIAATETVMARMQLDAGQRKAAIRLFNQGKQAGFPLHDVLTQFLQECHRRRSLVQVFLEIQIATAMADGRLHDAERRLLYHIGEVLGFDRGSIDQLLHLAGHAGATPGQGVPLAEAYAMLGVDRKAGDAEVTRAYRRLMNQHHPDKLIARGLPEEMIQIATEKTQQIKAAYEQIKSARGMK